jgi:hypothetical protein
MGTVPSSASGAPAAQRPRRWRRRLALALVVLLLAGGAAAVVSVWTATSDLDRVLAEMDRLDPGWRMEDIEAKRRAVPDAENSALQILAVMKARGGAAPATTVLDKMFRALTPDVRLDA